MATTVEGPSGAKVPYFNGGVRCGLASLPFTGLQVRIRGVILRARSYRLETETLARRAAEIALDSKALDVVVVDLRKRQAYAEFLVIASGTSDRHVQSVAEQTEGALKKEGAPIVGAEGAREGQWAIIDLGSVVVHVFHQFARDVYDLESLYPSAPRTRYNENGTRVADDGSKPRRFAQHLS